MPELSPTQVASQDAAERADRTFGRVRDDQIAREQRLTSKDNPNANANSAWLARFHAKFGGDLR